MRDIIIRFADFFASIVRSTTSPLASLDRTIAAAGHAHLTARRARAVAIAEETREIKRRDALIGKVSDLEDRAVKAIRAGREDLGMQASEAIAAMATEINLSHQASARFAAEVALARREVDAQRRRLSDLDRGRRLAKVGHALNSVAADSHQGLDRFAEAEATLQRINANNDDARAVRDELAPPSERLIQDLSDAGFGDATLVRPLDVMARLKTMASAPEPILVESSVRS